MSQAQPDLNALLKLIEERKEKQNQLEQLAKKDVHQARVFDKPGFGQMFGHGASPEQSRVMLQMLSSNPQRGETRMDAWSRGLLKGQDLRNEALQAKQDRQIAAAQMGVKGAADNYGMGKDVYAAQRDAETQAYTRQQQEEQTAFNRGKKGVVTIGGVVYETDAQGNIGRALGSATAPKAAEPFSLSEGQKRYDANGNLIAENQSDELDEKSADRLEELSSQQASRVDNIDKATRFLDAFTSGAESGTSRTAASFIPGVYSDQGSFDQELNSFAEEAARAQLKANGEIRPTDADVKGMKEALFGVGKDEATNINLLTSYLRKQVALENEQRALQGQPPMPIPTGTDVGEDWYKQLYQNTASGGRTNVPSGSQQSGRVIKW